MEDFTALQKNKTMDQAREDFWKFWLVTVFTTIHMDENINAVSWEKMCFIFYQSFLSDTKSYLAARKITDF